MSCLDSFVKINWTTGSLLVFNSQCSFNFYFFHFVLLNIISCLRAILILLYIWAVSFIFCRLFKRMLFNLSSIRVFELFCILEIVTLYLWRKMQIISSHWSLLLWSFLLWCFGHAKSFIFLQSSELIFLVPHLGVEAQFSLCPGYRIHKFHVVLD
jgi:hypothetical protein